MHGLSDQAATVYGDSVSVDAAIPNVGRRPGGPRLAGPPAACAYYVGHLLKSAERVEQFAAANRGVPPVGIRFCFDGGDETAVANLGDGSVVTGIVRDDVHADEASSGTWFAKRQP